MSEQLSFKLQIFEGPLDLLLHLIKKNKVSIYDIPILEIADQYMAYLSVMEEMDLELSSEFSVMAAQLLYMKSKLLLPKHEEETEEDPRRELVDRLVEYQRIKQAREELRRIQFAGTFSYYKLPQKIEGLKLPRRPEHVDLKKLTDAFMVILERTERKMPPPVERFDGIIGREVVSVQSKIDSIVGLVKKRKRVAFERVFLGVKSKSEAVSAFLAILELLRAGFLNVMEEGDSLYLSGTEAAPDVIDISVDKEYA